MGNKLTINYNDLHFLPQDYVLQSTRQAQTEPKQCCIDLTIPQRSKPELVTRTCLTTVDKNPFTDLTLNTEPSLQRPDRHCCLGK
jgi:hypothetical protein